MTLTYSTYQAQLANLMVESISDPNFQTFLPGCIDYAEQRIYRDLDLLATRTSDSSVTLTANTRTFTLPTNTVTFLVIEELNIITPAGTGTATGVRNPLVFVSKEWIDAVYPSAAQYTNIPQFYAMLNNTTVLLGPAPNAAYTIEVIGTYRPTPLSPTNTTTILTTMLPDLFIAASMVFGTGYMRDFGAQADNPTQGISWESQYQTLMKSADVEEFRKKHMSEGWTSAQPEVAASPPRV